MCQTDKPKTADDRAIFIGQKLQLLVCFCLVISTLLVPLYTAVRAKEVFLLGGASRWGPL